MTTGETAAAPVAVARAAADETIDVTRPVTWPLRLRDLVDAMSDAAPATEYTGDLELPDNADDRVRALLAGQRLRAYHATRLLDHERDMITKQGLRVFSRELFDERIRAAYAHAEISAAEHQQLLNAHMYATGEQHTRGHREGKVCLVLSDHAFDDSPSGLRPLLGTWGGEGIYYSMRGIPMEAFLRRLGRPTIVVASVPVLPSEASQPSFPDLARVLVGAVRGLRVEAELHHPEPIPPTA